MTDVPLQDEVAFLQGQRAMLQEYLRKQKASGSIDPVNRLVDESLANRQVVTLRAPVDDDFLLPGHFAKTMAPARLRELRVILGELRAFCAGLAGMTDDEAIVRNNGDETVILLRESLTDLMVAHARDRLARPAPRDHGQPFATWFRLMAEFGWWYGDLTAAVEPGIHAVLGASHRRVAWELYRATWRCHVEFDWASGNLKLHDVHPLLTEIAVSFIQVFGWETEGAIQWTMSQFPELAVGVTGTHADLTAELALLADDLRETKALLIRGYKPIERVIPLPGGAHAVWGWDVGQRLGYVGVARDTTSLTAPYEEGALAYYVAVGLDGRIVESMMPWLDIGEDAVRWAVGLLRPVHARLVADWYAAPRPAPVQMDAHDPVAEEEVIAVACEVLAEAEPEETGGATGYRHRVPAVREGALMLLMERHFGCEVKFAKGSEVTIYRPGGKKFTLPGKRRGQHMPSFVIAQMLKRLGVPAAEFAAVVRKEV